MSSSKEFTSVHNTQGQEESVSNCSNEFSPPLAETVLVEVDAAPVGVNVVAPANLPEGYELNVTVGGLNLRVAVPPGGVQEGQPFQAIVLPDRQPINDTRTSQNAEENNAKFTPPRGSWRGRLCECWMRLCNAQTCLTIWCPPCAVGQIMTRMSLGYCGKPLMRDKIQKMSTYRFVLFFTVLFEIFIWATSAMVNVNNRDGKPYVTDDKETSFLMILEILQDVFSLAFAIYCFVITVRTRKFIRQKYEIPTKCCGKCEDLCCSVFCGICTVTQMAHHTADLSQANCCSDNGLDHDASYVV